MKAGASPRKTYRCEDCNAAFRLNKEPVFCPFCGGERISQDNSKAREYAMSLIDECNALAEELKPLWDMYVKSLAQYEDKMQILRTYKMRGIVSEDELPKYEKKTLASELARYRRENKGRKKNDGTKSAG